MTRDEILAALDEVSAAMHATFDDDEASRDRLDQFDSHVGTVRMVVEHAHDEAERRAAEAE